MITRSVASILSLVPSILPHLSPLFANLSGRQFLPLFTKVQSDFTKVQSHFARYSRSGESEQSSLFPYVSSVLPRRYFAQIL